MTIEGEGADPNLGDKSLDETFKNISARNAKR
jgi:hypothetical protein